MEMTLKLGSSDKPKKEIPQVETQEESQMSAFNAAYQSIRLDEGKLGLFETVEEEARRNYVATKIPDAMKNKEYYDKFIDMNSYTIGDTAKALNRNRYEKAVENGLFDLDENGNVIDGPSHFFGADLLFDKDTIKGFILAKRNGYNENALRTEYQNIVKGKKELFKKAEDDLTGTLLGGLTGYLASPETATDFASPSKIMGSTIVKGALKAFGVESLYVALGETSREASRKRHALMMDEDRTLWDSTQEILINSGFAGAFRGIGSTIVDANIMRQIHSKIPDVTDKQIFSRYAQRENYKLTQNSMKHIHLVEKAQEDLENGKVVDISEHTDIDINEKFTDDAEPINIVEEIKNNPDIKIDAEMKQAIDNHIDEAIAEETDPYYADDSLIDEFMQDDDFLNDPEVKQLMEEYNISQGTQEQQAIDTGSVEYGKIIEDAEAQLNDTKFQSQNMYVGDEIINKTDFDLIKAYQKTRKWNRENPTKKRQISEKQKQAYLKHANIADDLQGWEWSPISEGNMLFSKFADNLAMGTIAGVETDEEGNITFDPAKFVAGLGGYTALKQAYKSGMFDNLPEEVNKQVKKHFGVDLEMGITDTEKPKGLLERKRAETQAKIDSGEIPEKGRNVKHPRSTKGYYLGESGKVYFNARGQWIEMPNEEVIKEVKEISEIGYNKFVEKEKMADEEFAKAVAESEAKEKAKLESPDFYKDAHTAPMRDKDSNTSIDDLLKIYPDDIYGNNAARYYGDGDASQDRISIKILQRIKGKPNATVTIYRTIPKDIDADINIGDWVTINKQYAREHGENRFDGKYKILQKDVKAKDIITDGNSIHEQGYDPITDTPKVKADTKKINYTEQELEKMIENGKGDKLDKLAFGYNDGEITNIKIDDINLIYDDIENAEYKFEKGGMDWVKSVKFDEPIQISIDENGKLNLEDGHHRYFAAKKLGKKEINAEIELKGNPVRKILKDQEETK